MKNDCRKSLRVIKKCSVGLLVFFLTLLSIYILWGWITMDDLHKYCDSNGLDFEKTLTALTPSESIGETKVEDNVLKIKDLQSGSYLPISRYLIPFNIMKVTKEGYSSTTGAVLTPFLAVTENTRNAICCFGIGYLVSLLVIGLEFLKEVEVSMKRFLLRPLLGGISATILFIVILSGGAFIWNEVGGVKGLSLGLVAVIGSLFCENFKRIVGLST